MNRYGLNKRTLGSGVSAPESYWAAALNVIVTASTLNFQVLRGVLVTSAVSIRANSVVGFIKIAHIASEMTAQVATRYQAIRKVLVKASQAVNVSSAVNASVGLLRLVSSAVTTGVNAVVSARVTMFTRASQLIIEATSTTFGKVQQWIANQNISESATTNFTSFGEYAPSERSAVVPYEDRDIGVS